MTGPFIRERVQGPPNQDTLFSLELCDHFDESAQILIELLEILGRYPPFRVTLGADCLDGIAVHKNGIHPKTSDVTDPIGRNVPFDGDFTSVFFIGDRIEKRLTKQARRPAAVAGLADKLELGRPNRSEALLKHHSGNIRERTDQTCVQRGAEKRPGLAKTRRCDSPFCFFY